MKTITLLHLSDLHYTALKCADSGIVLNALMTDLQKLAHEENVRPDLVAFSGDLVLRGDDCSDFEAAINDFISPLLQTLQIDKDYFLIAPGNHDIQVSKIDEIQEAGFNVTIKDRDRLNQFLDDMANRHQYFARLENFNKLKGQIETRYKISSNILYSTYKFDLRGTSVGVACLNSSWRASGKPENFDHGRLLIGERQIDRAVKDITGCDLKVAITHHPFEWLDPFDGLNCRGRTFTEFDLLLLGHNHNPNPELVQTSTGGAIISNCGSLYASREYYNGYSIIIYDLDKSEFRVMLRTYFDQRREFDKAINYTAEGEYKFPYNPKTKKPYDKSALPVIAALGKQLLEHANQALLMATTDSLAPKDFRQIFVEPPLSKKSEHEHMLSLTKTKEGAARSKTYIHVKELISSAKNYLIVGKKESGKTTLLNHICLAAIESEDIANTKFPFYLNYKEFRPGSNIVQRAMQDSITTANVPIDIGRLLEQGQCLLLIDDFSFEKSKSLQRVLEFVRDHSNNRFIFVIEDELYSTLDVEKLPDLGVPYEKIHLHSFTRSSTKQLVRNWFANVPVDVESLVDKLLQHLSAVGIPRSPVVLSLMLWILEKNDDYMPINRASLVEKFIEIRLEKLKLSDAHRAILDYRIKEHYLCHIAHLMTQRDRYYLELPDLEEETLGYFKSRGLRVSVSSVIEHFIDKGIFVNVNGLVSFKFKCFCEYFIAKRLIEDEEFFNEIIRPENYLLFSNEIDFVTGLQRDNKKLLALLSIRIEELFLETEFPLNLDVFETIELHQSILDTSERQELISSLREARPSEDERDDLLEVQDRSESGQSIVRHDHSDRKTQFMQCLMLLSRVLRNCELVDDLELKKNSLRSTLVYWGKLTLMLMLLCQDHLESQASEELKDHKDKIYDFVSVLLPLIVQSAIRDQLGSEKLEMFIRDGIKESQNELYLNILYTFLYVDLKLPGYVDEIKLLVKKVAHIRYFAEIIVAKLTGYYLLGDLSKGERQAIENLIAEVYLHKDKWPDKKGQLRGKIITQLRKTLLETKQTRSPDFQV